MEMLRRHTVRAIEREKQRENCDANWIQKMDDGREV